MNTRIDHVANAIKALNGITAEMRTDVATVVVQGAQVNAALALVEQQRIANLIAYDRSRVFFRGYQGAEAKGDREIEIRTALGLPT